jgi:hypothetical protein
VKVSARAIDAIASAPSRGVDARARRACGARASTAHSSLNTHKKRAMGV